MVNIIIYIEKNQDPMPLVTKLLEEKWIANATIDVENESYRALDNQITKTINTVITCQTKSLHFSKIAKIVALINGEKTPIYSIPVTQSNNSFDILIRENTQKI